MSMLALIAILIGFLMPMIGIAVIIYLLFKIFRQPKYPKNSRKPYGNSKSEYPSSVFETNSSTGSSADDWTPGVFSNSSSETNYSSSDFSSSTDSNWSTSSENNSSSDSGSSSGDFGGGGSGGDW